MLLHPVNDNKVSILKEVKYENFVKDFLLSYFKAIQTSIKLKSTSKTVKNLKLNLKLLKTNTAIKEQYTVEVKNRFTGLEEIQDVEQRWVKLKDALTQSATETVPTMKTTGKRKWMTEEILELMEKRRLAKPNKVRDKEINKEIKRKCGQAKEKWLNEQCEEIETELYKEPKAMYKRIQEITGRKASSKTGYIKSKDGSIIMEKDKKLERWSEYISELFDDDRNEDLTLQDIPKGPEIIREEVENTIKNMKTGKATGPDMISTEMMQALEGIELDAITKMLNTIYDTGEIPKEMLQSIFIVLPKKTRSDRV